MLKTDCAKCIHGDLCKVRESRQQFLNMVADQLGPTFDLYCKEWKDKSCFEIGRISCNTNVFYADNRPAQIQVSCDNLKTIHERSQSLGCALNIWGN